MSPMSWELNHNLKSSCITIWEGFSQNIFFLFLLQPFIIVTEKSGYHNSLQCLSTPDYFLSNLPNGNYVADGWRFHCNACISNEKVVN